MFDFSGKKIIVTGASSGVGRETAILLSKMNAQVVLIARRENELEKTMSMLNKGAHYYKVADLSDFNGTIRTFKDIVTLDGKKIDGVAHCAGAARITSIRAVTEAILDNMFRLNLYSFAAILKCAASKRYFNPRASIIAISSNAALDGQKGNVAYSAAKAAMIGLVKAADFELRERDIRTNLILPVGIDTEMLRNLPNQGSMLKIDSTKLMSPRQIADIISFYLSPCSEPISSTYLLFGE